MYWVPRVKFIDNLKTIRVSQSAAVTCEPIAFFNDLSFVRSDLAISAARTRLLSVPLARLPEKTRTQLMLELGEEAAKRVSLFLQEGAEFCFASYVDILADDESTALASLVGTAVTDLTMERLGFHFRANARDLGLRPPRKAESKDEGARIPDFVYDPGAAHGYASGTVAIVEAKGSLSKTRAKSRRVWKTAQNAYNDQVRRYIGAECRDGTVVAGGFAVAFGAVPGSETSSLAIASTHVFTTTEQAAFAPPVGAASAIVGQPAYQQQEEAEDQEIYHPQERFGGDGGSRGGGKRTGRRRRPSGRVLFANYEVVFELSGASNVARLLRRILSGPLLEDGEADRMAQEFEIWESDGRFLVGADCWAPFAIYEPSARDILEIVGANLDGPPATAEIDLVPEHMLGGEEARLARLDAAPIFGRTTIQGDGLALMGTRSSSGERCRWHPSKGWS